MANFDFIPNSFQTPNVIVDRLLPVFPGSDITILLYVCRKTFGWNKRRDVISLTQFENGTGLSRRALITRLEILVAVQLLKVEPSPTGNVYELNLECDVDEVLRLHKEAGEQSSLVKKVHQKMEKSSPVTGEQSSPTETQDKPTKNPSLSSAENADEERPLTGRIQEYIKAKHLAQFNAKCQWDGSEGKIVKKLVESNPSWTAEDWKRMIRNRFGSEAITPDRPRTWLQNISKYAAGPLDRFGKLLGAPKVEPPKKILPNPMAVLQQQEAERKARRAAAGSENASG